MARRCLEHPDTPADAMSHDKRLEPQRDKVLRACWGRTRWTILMRPTVWVGKVAQKSDRSSAPQSSHWHGNRQLHPHWTTNSGSTAANTAGGTDPHPNPSCARSNPSILGATPLFELRASNNTCCTDDRLTPSSARPNPAMFLGDTPLRTSGNYQKATVAPRIVQIRALRINPYFWTTLPFALRA